MATNETPKTTTAAMMSTVAKTKRPKTTKPPTPAPIVAPAPKTVEAPKTEAPKSDTASDIGGKPLTLRRLMTCAAHLDPFASAATMTRRGARGGWEALRSLGLASLTKLLPGPETSAWIVRKLLSGGALSAVAAVESARVWADAIIADVSALGDSNAAPEWHVERVGSIMTRKARPADPIVNRVSAIAYVMTAPARLPAWVVDAPIPDSLREPGVDALVIRAEALAATVNPS